MRILAMIPARGGSKGIPRKNLADLGGRPLIAWSIEAALKAGCFEKVIVSTDDQEIANVSSGYGADVPFLRPSEFAGDTAPALGVIAHGLDHFSEQGDVFDAVAYLQPTSPFRTAAQIEDAYRKFGELAPETLVSVVSVPHNMTANSIMRPSGSDGNLWLESPHGQTMRRQEKETQFARNGPAILIVSRGDILEKHRLYGDRVLGFEMEKLSSFDIDDAADLEMARYLAPLSSRNDKLPPSTL